MPQSTLGKRWQNFQLDRVQKIQQWYVNHYRQAHTHDPIIQYIVLWSVFNALYNTLDIPNNTLPDKVNGRYKFKLRLGYKIPVIKTSSDFDRLMKIAEKLAGNMLFIALLNEEYIKQLIEIFVKRIPSIVNQEKINANRAIPITLPSENNQLTEDEFIPASIRGVASIDRRLFLSDGYKFFEYAAIDNPWNDHGELVGPELTTKQLFNVLYQLRNNVVHGGTTAHRRKDIINEALPILDAVVGFIFENRDDIYVKEAQ